MRLKFAVRDTDYMKALVEALQRSDQSVYAEIGRDFGVNSDTLIVTDISPGELQSTSGRRSTGGVVFLSEDSTKCNLKHDYPCFVYKYGRISEILADLRYYYFRWTGKGTETRNDARLVSVQTDTDSEVGRVFAQMLARQYVYRIGGEVLIVPLSFVDCSDIHHDDRYDCFAKLMYCISAGKPFPREAFYYRDSFGVSHIRTGVGINPIAGLGDDDLQALIEHVTSRSFDLVILDIGSEFSDRNLKLVRRSGHKFWLHRADESDRRDVALVKAVFGDDTNFQRVTLSIKRDRLPLTADDYVRRMFSAGQIGDADEADGIAVCS